MTGLCSERLLLSLPGVEVQNSRLSGSIVEVDEVLAGSGSSDVRSALRLICGACERHGGAVSFIARPEMFVHGAAAAWLRERMGQTRAHICLSDGTTIKHLPGLPTHVFFYGFSQQTGLRALQKLVLRAPELMAGVKSQINSCFILGDGVGAQRPRPTILNRASPPMSVQSELWPFFFNRHSPADCLARTRRHGPVATDDFAWATKLLYVLLTDAAMGDRAFVRAVGALVLQASHDPAVRLVLRLPASDDVADPLASGMAILLTALADVDIVLPRARLSNVATTAQDLAEDHPLFDGPALHIIVHEYCDFWRHTAHFYSRAARVTVVSGREAADFPALPYDVSAIYGPNAVRRWVGMP